MQVRAGASWGLWVVGAVISRDPCALRPLLVQSPGVPVGALSWSHGEQLLTPWLDTEGKSDQEGQGSWEPQVLLTHADLNGLPEPGPTLSTLACPSLAWSPGTCDQCFCQVHPCPRGGQGSGAIPAFADIGPEAPVRRTLLELAVPSCHQPQRLFASHTCSFQGIERPYKAQGWPKSGSFSE